MFINVSNHPSAKWSPAQVAAAMAHRMTNGKLFDLPHPVIDPRLTTAQVSDLAHDVASRCLQMEDGDVVVVHVAGEPGFCYALVNILRREADVEVVHSTTERISVDNPDGTKTSRFEFVAFRQYGGS